MSQAASEQIDAAYQRALQSIPPPTNQATQQQAQQMQAQLQNQNKKLKADLNNYVKEHFNELEQQRMTNIQKAVAHRLGQIEVRRRNIQGWYDPSSETDDASAQDEQKASIRSDNTLSDYVIIEDDSVSDDMQEIIKLEAGARALSIDKTKQYNVAMRAALSQAFERYGGKFLKKGELAEITYEKPGADGVVRWAQIQNKYEEFQMHPAQLRRSGRIMARSTNVHNGVKCIANIDANTAENQVALILGFIEECENMGYAPEGTLQDFFDALGFVDPEREPDNSKVDFSKLPGKYTASTLREMREIMRGPYERLQALIQRSHSAARQAQASPVAGRQLAENAINKVRAKLQDDDGVVEQLKKGLTEVEVEVKKQHIQNAKQGIKEMLEATEASLNDTNVPDEQRLLVYRELETHLNTAQTQLKAFQASPDNNDPSPQSSTDLEEQITQTINKIHEQRAKVALGEYEQLQEAVENRRTNDDQQKIIEGLQIGDVAAICKLMEGENSDQVATVLEEQRMLLDAMAAAILAYDQKISALSEEVPEDKSETAEERRLKVVKRESEKNDQETKRDNVYRLLEPSRDQFSNVLAAANGLAESENKRRFERLAEQMEQAKQAGQAIRPLATAPQPAN